MKSGRDGLFLDVAAPSHLFGGEASLIADLAARLAHFGLPARAAIATTAGAAWALARFGKPDMILMAGAKRPLAALPIEALRLAVKRAKSCAGSASPVGALLDNPRAPFAARFERELLLRWTKHWAAHPPRSPTSCRRRSITACAT